MNAEGGFDYLPPQIDFFFFFNVLMYWKKYFVTCTKYSPTLNKYIPNPMIKKRANSLAYVNMSWTFVAHLTSQQLMKVSTTANAKWE